MKQILKKSIEYILLSALPVLMFSYLPFKKSMSAEMLWQCVFIGLGGILFLISLSNPFPNWLFAGFFFIIFLRVVLVKATFQANIPFILRNIYLRRLTTLSYITLFSIFIGLFLISKYKELDKNKTMNMICITALLLIIWGLLQKTIFIDYLTFFKCINSYPPFPLFGAFNILGAGVLLAVCLPAFYRSRWIYFIPFLIYGLYLTGRATGIITAIFSTLFFLISKKLTKISFIILIFITTFGFIYFTKIDSYKRIINSDRFIVWNYAIKSFGNAPLGHGLGSWKELFPYYAGNNGKYWWNNAHNEYVELIFNIGWIAIIIILIFFGWFILNFNKLSRHAISAICGIAVSCFGFNSMQIAPIALVACAWFGIYFQEINNKI